MSVARARLTMKLVSTTVLLVITVVSARSCSSPSKATSPLNPTQLARNGVAALCANQQATEDAGGGSPGGSGTPAVDLGSLQGVAAGAGLPAGSLTCPTTPPDSAP